MSTLTIKWVRGYTVGEKRNKPAYYAVKKSDVWLHISSGQTHSTLRKTQILILPDSRMRLNLHKNDF